MSGVQKRRRGRPTKLTPARSARICQLIRAGHYRIVAATQSGVGGKTFYEWLARGEPTHPNYRKIYYDFRKAVIKAEAESEIILLDKVLAGGPKYALEVLKRRFPERWGDRQRLDLSGVENGQAIKVEHEGGAAPSVTVVIADADDVWDPADGIDDGDRD